MSKPETFVLARLRLWFYLKDLGWKASKPQKELWAEHPTLGVKVRFHAQAVYVNEHSLWLDMRETSGEDLVRAVEYRAKQLAGKA